MNPPRLILLLSKVDVPLVRYSPFVENYRNAFNHLLI